MINSRCPRPIGIIASIALIPVWSGSFTGVRSTTPGSDALHRHEVRRLNRALPVFGLAERVHDASDDRLSRRHLHDASRPPDLIALLDQVALAEENRADAVLLEVERHPHDAVGKLQQLARHRLLEPVDPRDAVTDRDDRPHLGEVHLAAEPLDLLPEDLADLVDLDLHPDYSFPIAVRSRASWVFRLPS